MNTTQKKILLSNLFLIAFLINSQARDFAAAKALFWGLLTSLVGIIGLLILIATTFPTKYPLYNKFSIVNSLFLLLFLSSKMLQDHLSPSIYGVLFWFQILSMIVIKILQVREKNSQQASKE